MGIFGAAAIEGASIRELHRAGASPTALQGFGLAAGLMQSVDVRERPGG